MVGVRRARRRDRRRRLARDAQPAAPPASTTRPRSSPTRCTSRSDLAGIARRPRRPGLRRGGRAATRTRSPRSSSPSIVVFAAGRLVKRVDRRADGPRERGRRARDPRARSTGLPASTCAACASATPPGATSSTSSSRSSADAGLAQAHTTADAIEDADRASALPGADVLVHVEPRAAEGDLRERATAAALSVPDVREIHNVRVMQVDGGYELSLHVKLPRGAVARRRARDGRAARGGDPRRGAASCGWSTRTSSRSRGPTGRASRRATRSRPSAQAIEDVVRRYTGQDAAARALPRRRARPRRAHHRPPARPTSRCPAPTGGRARSSTPCASAARTSRDVIVHTEPGERLARAG